MNHSWRSQNDGWRVETPYGRMYVHLDRIWDGSIAGISISHRGTLDSSAVGEAILTFNHALSDIVPPCSSEEAREKLAATLSLLPIGGALDDIRAGVIAMINDAQREAHDGKAQDHQPQA